MRIHPFVCTWNGQFERAVALEGAIAAAFGPVTVINAEAGVTRPGWVNVGEEAFMAAQFRRALALFLAGEADVLFQVQADASYEAWEEIRDAAVRAHHHFNWGVFAPNVDYTSHAAGRVDLINIRIPRPGLRAVACTDCTCWFLHRDVAQALWAQQTALEATRMGWGLDILAAALSYLAGRPVLRDYSNTVRHPRGTGYDREEAAAEMFAMLGNLPEEIQLAAYRIHHQEHHGAIAGYLKPAP